MYLAGRRFTLVTDCSALTWLFKSRDLSPKLHRWALRLMEYDFVLQWRPGSLHHAPDAFSRLPPDDGATQHDIDTSFPDDSNRPRSTYVGPRGPTLNGEALDAQFPVGVTGEGKKDSIPLSALCMESAEATAAALTAPRPEVARHARKTLGILPFAHCAVLNPDAPICRSDRARKPSVRLRPLDETPARRVQVDSNTTSANAPGITA